VAQADDAERAALNLAAQHLRLQLPPARAGDALLLRQALGQGQHQQQRRRGGRVVQRVGDVEQGDAVLGAGGDVDFVVTRPRAADDHEVRRRDEGGASDVRAQDDQAVDAGELIRRDLQRVEPTPVIGVTRARGLLRQEAVADVGPRREQADAGIADGDAAVRAEEIAGEGDVEGAHRRL
jgi:hypothetical protein